MNENIQGMPHPDDTESMENILLWKENGKWHGVRYVEIINTCKPFYEWQVKDNYIIGNTLEELLINLKPESTVSKTTV